MALLQISEPGQSPELHERKRAVGIDLGTTNSLVASVINGQATTLPDEQARYCYLQSCDIQNPIVSSASS